MFSNTIAQDFGIGNVHSWDFIGEERNKSFLDR